MSTQRIVIGSGRTAVPAAREPRRAPTTGAMLATAILLHSPISAEARKRMIVHYAVAGGTVVGTTNSEIAMPSDVRAWCAREGIAQYLGAVSQLVRSCFSGDPTSWSVESDPESEDERLF